MLIERMHATNSATYPPETAERLEQAEKQTLTAEAISLDGNKRNKQELHKHFEQEAAERETASSEADLPPPPREGSSAGLLVDIVA